MESARNGELWRGLAIEPGSSLVCRAAGSQLDDLIRAKGTEMRRFANVQLPKVAVG